MNLGGVLSHAEMATFSNNIIKKEEKERNKKNQKGSANVYNEQIPEHTERYSIHSEHTVCPTPSRGRRRLWTAGEKNQNDVHFTGSKTREIIKERNALNNKRNLSRRERDKS